MATPRRTPKFTDLIARDQKLRHQIVELKKDNELLKSALVRIREFSPEDSYALRVSTKALEKFK